MKFVINIFILSLLVQSLCHAQVTLRFQEHIDASAHTLGDILHIENDKQHWADLPLQSHPKTGEFISKAKVIQWMKLRLGDFDREWIGKTHIQVEASQQALKNTFNATIKKGTLIQVSATNHGITVIMDAVTLTQGKIGQIIQVQNSRSQKTFQVRITGSNQAEAVS